MNTILKQNNALELFMSLKMAISCCFGLRGNLDFPDFLQKSFITSTTGRIFCIFLQKYFKIFLTSREGKFWKMFPAVRPDWAISHNLGD